MEETPPQILKEGQSFEKHQTTLRDISSLLLHLWQLSRKDHYSVKFRQEQREKLKYYWSGQVNVLRL